MSNEENSSKEGDRLYCRKWNGTRSPDFISWKRDFKTGASAHFLHEDDYSIWQALEDKDQGGQDANAPALPAQGVNGHAQAVRRRWRRQSKAYERVYSHQDDERIKDMLDLLQVWRIVQSEGGQGRAGH